MQNFHLTTPQDSFKQYDPLRQEYYVPQYVLFILVLLVKLMRDRTDRLGNSILHLSPYCSSSPKCDSNGNDQGNVCPSSPVVTDISGVKGFFAYMFLSGPAWTGWIMTISLGVMVWFAMEKRRRANYER